MKYQEDVRDTGDEASAENTDEDTDVEHRSARFIPSATPAPWVPNVPPAYPTPWPPFVPSESPLPGPSVLSASPAPSATGRGSATPLKKSKRGRDATDIASVLRELSSVTSEEQELKRRKLVMEEKNFGLQEKLVDAQIRKINMDILEKEAEIQEKQANIDIRKLQYEVEIKRLDVQKIFQQGEFERSKTSISPSNRRLSGTHSE
ncbi:hypothetical protein BGZ65_007168 [Modicella reniformis]|uniref:No apical meristem-associated C-terminal domain-containing protein n=1 Tax=Modicella reniformis TaxID=1440133 RepID=A0A9P6MFP8_9FUNG|nr:hypothetical protein BGZ65_007168 [Modicella reniformis]